MATLLRVPEVATGSTEAVLTEWLVPENVAFEAGAAIAVLETDKAAVEVEAESGAAVLRRLVDGGSTVEVGTPIAVLGAVGEDIGAVLAELGSGAVQAAAAEPVPAAGESVAAPERIFASPLARKLLKEAGIALADVQGTGPNGRIVRKDVEAAIAAEADSATAPAEATAASDSAVAPAPAAAIPAPPAGPSPRPGQSAFVEVPHSRVRAVIASRLTASKQTVPHFYLRRTARIDALLALRKQLNEVSPERISVNDLVIRAVAVAHVAVPDANVIWTDDAMRRYESVDIGVAIASERGLVTPVLRGVEKTSLSEISRQVKAFAQQADAGRLMQRDLEGGTIAVSNLGRYGVDEFAAIINPPQSAILAVGAGKPAPTVEDGELKIATQLNLVLSVDHRAIDGALAAQWMAALVTALEEPLRLVA
ncbi:dihydrolipoamide acetyltransferase family protein [Kutzneria buriramensis]|uniref:Dihydrolipoamide acetyltransferase component of pyruvate dehydrogenase complex n=1 Tax=Kutzneria buriramensis TaxID=1045776 RepID=A0A3E0GZF7_9PSEU|nr:dihydrolipoamide acetyltransferase family protein [Kutzneria buriramensis]REH32945.1 pyruvate dehydrogenase E2 component (dihydrolipoamide acetyltransferase) [Kutzneria buriramensis]